MKLPKAYAKWLSAPSLIKVFDAIEAAGGEVQVNGGAVRNSLMGLKVDDIDLSTTLVPEKTIKALEAAGLRAIPTGLEHGTITAVSDKIGYEITTLREDIETDGRHAVVKFGTNWELDANRRDLTMNALYCDRDGGLFDPLGGLKDIESKTIRFIGEASERIEEDYLRILRFFRFFAWYGCGRPDAAGLKACAKLKNGLSDISVERIWMELRKLLNAPDPSRALLWMRTTGVLSVVLPETEKWGIDLIPHLISAEAKWRWKIDPLLRLQSIIRPDGEVATNLARRLKLSKAESSQLTAWAIQPLLPPHTDEKDLSKTLYYGDRKAIAAKLKLEVARLVSHEEAGSEDTLALAQNCKFISKWKRPVFPLKGQDLLDIGKNAGPKLGAELSRLEKAWVDSGFKLTKLQLLDL